MGYNWRLITMKIKTLLLFSLLMPFFASGVQANVKPTHSPLDFYTPYGFRAILETNYGYSIHLLKATNENNVASSQNQEKCKSCQGSGQCRGYGSVQSIKLHCAATGKCSTCGGKGLMSTGFGGETRCSQCNGSGKCTYCKGTGKCDRCNGTGYRR